jgi:hypothetical protein
MRRSWTWSPLFFQSNFLFSSTECTYTIIPSVHFLVTLFNEKKLGIIPIVFNSTECTYTLTLLYIFGNTIYLGLTFLALINYALCALLILQSIAELVLENWIRAWDFTWDRFCSFSAKSTIYVVYWSYLNLFIFITLIMLAFDTCADC